MNHKTIEIFHALMKNGWIDRQENQHLWQYIDNLDIQEELEVFKEVIGIDLFRVKNRLYLIPTQDNDLFLKNNIDYRRDIKADSSVRIRDLYLMNYLSIYLIYIFFSGEGNDALCRDFITKEEFITLFTEHCKSVEKISLNGDDNQLDYSDNFIQLASNWLSKLDGEPTSQKFDNKYGIVNRILNKHKTDELFEVTENNLIRPTRKLKDLMPYFLRKDRINEIQNWIKEEEKNATNQ